MNGISEEEAVQLFEGIRKNSQSDGIAPYADLVDHYQVVSKTFTYSKNSTYSATSEATLWLRGKGSYFQIQGVVGSATLYSLSVQLICPNQAHCITGVSVCICS